jgi:hypothetical protein
MLSQVWALKHAGDASVKPIQYQIRLDLEQKEGLTIRTSRISHPQLTHQPLHQRSWYRSPGNNACSQILTTPII